MERELRNELEESQEALREARKSLASTESAHQQVLRRLDEVAGERQSLRRKVGSLEASRQSLASELDEVKARLSRQDRELDSRRDELRERLSASRGTEADLRQRIERLEKTLATSKADRRRLEDELGRVADEREELRHEVDTLKTAQEHFVAESRRARAEADRAREALGNGAPPERETAPPREAERTRAPAGRFLRGTALLAAGVVLGALLFGSYQNVLAKRRGASPVTRVAQAGGEPDRPASLPAAPPVSTESGPVAGEPPADGAAQRSAQPPAAAARARPLPSADPGTGDPDTGDPGVDPPGAAADVAEPPTERPAAETAVLAWAAAWSDQRADDYLAHYSAEFLPPDELGRRAWAADRRQRVLRPASIRVTVSNLETFELAPDQVRVRFDQDYRSDTYSDQVRKTLILVWEEGAWRISEERSSS